MAKSKRKGQKPRSVFHIASQKNFKGKSKAKPVTTKLKKNIWEIGKFLHQDIDPSRKCFHVKINIVNDEKVRRMNQAFIDIQKELAHFSKGLSLEPLQKQRSPQQCHENRSVNVDEATRLMAQL